MYIWHVRLTDLTLRCPQEEILNFSYMRPVKILIRLRECPGWSESSWAHMSEGMFYDVAAQSRTVSGYESMPLTDFFSLNDNVWLEKLFL